jgi:4-amino-4-deoxy-L-arabinose transferase-like glycosyltransferase
MTIRLLLIILGCKAALLSLFILSGALPLGPDEAQYWTWSKRLDIGYYSKPPGIAYQIALGTFLFGDNEWGVRFLSLVIGTLEPLLIYLLARVFFRDEKKALMAAAAWALSPVGFIGSILAITDVAMILFLTVALIGYLRTGISWKVGLMIALGALFKWPIYFFWLWVGLEEIINKRRIPIFPILLSLIGIVPSVMWNLTHEGATFRHVFATLSGGSDSIKAARGFFGNPIEFFGAQIALFSPLFFVMIFRQIRLNDFIARSFFITFFMAIGVSVFMKLQGNWAIFIYPLGFVLLGDRLREKSLVWGSAISLVIILAIPLLPYKMSPLKHNLGANNISSALSSVGMKQDDFIAAGSYQLAAQASFYNPFQSIAYFMNIDGRRENQFSFWPPLSESHKQEGWFLSDKGDDGRALENFFRTVSPPIVFPLYYEKKIIYLYRVRHPFVILPSHQKHY